MNRQKLDGYFHLWEFIFEKQPDVGIYFRKTTGRGNLFSKRRASSKYPKIKTFRKLPAIR